MKLSTFIILLGISAILTTTYFKVIRDAPFDTIQDNINKSSVYIHNITVAIEKRCKGVETCEIVEVKEFVENNLKTRPDEFLQDMFMLDNDVDYTFRNGNDCDGWAVFSAYMLKEFKIKNVYLFEGFNSLEGHAWIGINRKDNMIMINNIPTTEISKARKLW